eukprot:5830614-Prorocentrum_lima.AAC.1
MGIVPPIVRTSPRSLMGSTSAIREYTLLVSTHATSEQYPPLGDLTGCPDESTNRHLNSAP